MRSAAELAALPLGETASPEGLIWHARKWAANRKGSPGRPPLLSPRLLRQSFDAEEKAERSAHRIGDIGTRPSGNRLLNCHGHVGSDFVEDGRGPYSRCDDAATGCGADSPREPFTGRQVGTRVGHLRRLVKRQHTPRARQLQRSTLPAQLDGQALALPPRAQANAPLPVREGAPAHVAVLSKPTLVQVLKPALSELLTPERAPCGWAEQRRLALTGLDLQQRNPLFSKREDCMILRALG
eukprot:CAMPEP_0181231378 /NCGR_PEP_ID=MMETSP1096-20121128/35067_1 /TAXON_ID=156174 ORGANISM="Chrysochromulina ericina, Strain CCMP281" /NCGR_SAMPLE_ID=MMETSP1096 /ASSEMBLY_ACC=CAM_ASM_000453 /LENGTH=239 /DNA_ID=CAMNT_0023325401 /DNA_START=27 /DNA_END=747 /DNA_ORIENTATION=+